MSRIKDLISRWKTDYDFRTAFGAIGSLAVTMIFALYNGFLGVYHSSLWHGAIWALILLLSVSAFLKGVRSIRKG